MEELRDFYNDDIICLYNEEDKEWTFVDARGCEDVEVAKMSSATYEVEYLFEKAQKDKTLNKYIKKLLKLVTDKEFRYISIQDGTGMCDDTFIIKTNAPVRELRELERISLDIRMKGGEYEDIPIWSIVLEEKGYVSKFIAECTSSVTRNEDENYPYVIEHYIIENQPRLLIEYYLYPRINRNIDNFKEDINNGRLTCVLGNNNKVYLWYLDEINSIAVDLDGQIIKGEEIKKILATDK